MSTPRVLFLCTGNSCRSQMAEGMARALSNGKVEAFSAGTHPKPIHPLAIKVMGEVGIDISKQRSKALTELVPDGPIPVAPAPALADSGQGPSSQPFDFVITVCDRANEECPVFPAVNARIHWSLDDPAQAIGSEAERLQMFRRVRDEIRQRVRLFLISNGLTG
jgi:arsenate reductase